MSIYRKLGVKPVINAWATVTTLGGSLMLPEVVEAMNEAAKAFVDMEELHRRAGEIIARRSSLRNLRGSCSLGAGSGGVYDG